MSLLTRDLFILTDPAVISETGSWQISLTAAASLFGDTLAIALRNLRKQDLTFSSNIF